MKEYFNYNSTRKNLNLSVISGKINPVDEKTRIILFRSHHGAVGQLLENIIKEHSQNTERKIQIIQDMSTQNTPKLSTVEVVGCAAHARRPFWRYRDHESYCKKMS